MPVTARRRTLFLLPFLLLSTISLFGQDRLDPAAMGAARTSIATARGIGAMMSNPGALDYFPLHPTTLPHDLTFSIYTVGGTIGGTYLAGDEFQQIFGALDGGTTNEGRERIGQLLVDERLFANSGVNFLSVVYRTEAGTFGLNYGSRLYARLNFPDDLANLIATSNIAAQNFRFVNRGIGGVWTTEFGLSYGKVFGDQTEEGWFTTTGVGATVKLIGGVAGFEVDENSAIFIDQINVGGQLRFLVRGGYVFRSAEPDNFDINNAPSNFLSNPFPSTAGFGIGLDAGMAGTMYSRDDRSVFYGIAFTNLGSINWSNRTKERTAEDLRDTLGARLSNAEFDRFDGDLVAVDDFSTTLPATLRAGLGIALGERGSEGIVTIGLEAETPLNDIPGNDPNPRASAGVEASVNKYLTLRGGVTLGGVSDFGLGIGVGVRPIDWLAVDVGTSQLNSIFSGDRMDLTARVSAGLKL